MTRLAAALLGLVLSLGPGVPALAQGVGDATWTPSISSTSMAVGSWLTDDDSLVFRTDASWDANQADGLRGYLDEGLRYTHEVRDRSGRSSATGYWATNHPDPSFDRDDDDGDGRWEEAEIIVGPIPPRPDTVYTTLIPFSRWHAKRARGTCQWAWDRRKGHVGVLSQLSRHLLGEWQALRYTDTYESLEFPRVGTRPALPASAPAARCGDPRPRPGQEGVIATFAEPLAWSDFLALVPAGTGRWTAFEAIGSTETDALPWTCGGPVIASQRLRPCRDLGVAVDGVTAAVGYVDGDTRRAIGEDPSVAHVDGLQDALTGLLFEIGGLGVVLPGLTVDDRYWSLFLSD